MVKVKVDILDKGKSFDKWLDGVRRKGFRNADTYGRNLCASLKRFSPVDSGEMANSWQHKTTKRSPLLVDLAITNSSHADKDVSVPILVDKGHGLRGGGYVKANPFIKKAINAVYDSETTRILEELLK